MNLLGPKKICHSLSSINKGSGQIIKLDKYLLFLLELFEYVGQSDYDLSFELKDEMTNLIRILTPDLIKTYSKKVAQNF